MPMLEKPPRAVLSSAGLACLALLASLLWWFYVQRSGADASAVDVGSSLGVPQAALEKYCRVLFAGNAAAQRSCLEKRLSNVAELSRTESARVHQRIARYCTQTFADDAVLQDLCVRDQSAALEGLRRHNAEPGSAEQE